MAVASLIIAVVALVVALASAAYTRRQAVVSEKAAAIEDQRRHDELTPELAVTCEERSGTRLADMTLELTGPAGIERLDQVTIRIRDDIPDRKPSPGSQLTQDQISDVIWDRTGSISASETPTSTGAHTGRSGCPSMSPTRVSLEWSIPPSWAGLGWRGQYHGQPVRLEITCRCGGYAPWTLRYEVDVKPDPAGQVM